MEIYSINITTSHLVWMKLVLNLRTINIETEVLASSELILNKIRIWFFTQS